MKLRVLPIVITGTALLLVLKGAGLLLTGHYAFEIGPSEAHQIAVAPTYRPSAAARTSNSWNADGYDPIATGSVPSKKPEQEAAPADPAADAAPVEAAATEAAAEPAGLEGKDPKDLSSSERALLDRLQSRREELDVRAGELDMRENLLRAAERKIEERISELKGIEERLAAAEAAKKAEDDKKLKDLVVMYENMKPKDAAAIFNRLDMKVLVEVATKMNPKKTGDIIAKMEPAAAERLTVALARREADLKTPVDTDALPKIGAVRQPN